MKIATPPPSRPPQRPQPPKPPESPEPEDRLHDLAAQGSVALGTYVAGSLYPTIYAHEWGHATAVNALFTGANPTITVNPLKGGVTHFQPTGFTPLGQRLGIDRSMATVAMAGTAVDLATSMVSFGVGYKLHKKHPYLGAAMMGYGALTTLNSVLYAGTALGLGGPIQAGNDFAQFAKRTGIPPLATMAVLASVIPLEYALLRLTDKHE